MKNPLKRLNAWTDREPATAATVAVILLATAAIMAVAWQEAIGKGLSLTCQIVAVLMILAVVIDSARRMTK